MEVIEQLVGYLPAPVMSVLVAVLIYYFFRHIKKENETMKNAIKVIQIDIESLIHALEIELQNGFAKRVSEKRKELTSKWKNIQGE